MHFGVEAGRANHDEIYYYSSEKEHFEKKYGELYISKPYKITETYRDNTLWHNLHLLQSEKPELYVQFMKTIRENVQNPKIYKAIISKKYTKVDELWKDLNFTMRSALILSRHQTRVDQGKTVPRDVREAIKTREAEEKEREDARKKVREDARVMTKKEQTAAAPDTPSTSEDGPIRRKRVQQKEASRKEPVIKAYDPKMDRKGKVELPSQHDKPSLSDRIRRFMGYR